MTPHCKQIRGTPHYATVEERLGRKLLGDSLDQVINLEDTPAAAGLAFEVPAHERFGAFWDGTKITYSESSCEWFDMSLSSRFGRSEADG
jgi:hypothetical protein